MPIVLAAIEGSLNVLAYGLIALGPALGLALIVSRTVETIGRQPEAANTLRPLMFIGAGLVEVLGLLGFVLAIIS